MYRNGSGKDVSKKIKDERTKNERITEIKKVKGKADILNIIQKKRQQWYFHVKRMPE